MSNGKCLLCNLTLYEFMYLSVLKYVNMKIVFLSDWFKVIKMLINIFVLVITFHRITMECLKYS